MVDKAEAKTIAGALAETGVRPAKKPPRQNGYPNLPLCVVDAVFSQAYRFGTAAAAVCALQRYWASNGLKPSVAGAKLTNSVFLDRIASVSPAALVETVFCDTRNALGGGDRSRAGVAIELCRNLAEQGLESKEDLRDPERSAALAAAVRATPGFGTGGAQYLLALTDDTAWETAALSSLLGRPVDGAEVAGILAAATRRLRKKQPKLAQSDVEGALWRSLSGFSKDASGCG